MNHNVIPSHNLDDDHSKEWRTVSPLEPLQIQFEQGADVQQYVDLYAGTREDEQEAPENSSLRFKIVDTRVIKEYMGQRIGNDVSYLIVQNSTVDFGKGRGYKGLRNGRMVDIGRNIDNPLRARMDLADLALSRDHFSVAASKDGDLFIIDNGSANGVEVSAMQGQDGDKHDADDNGFEESQPSEQHHEVSHDREMSERLIHLAEPFSVDSEAAQPDRFGNKRDQRAITTPESLRLAEMAMRYIDPKIKETLKAAMAKENISLDGVPMSELIRTNHVVRVMLLDHIMRKFQDDKSNVRYPDRVYDNTEKNPNHSGYETMTSREYAGVLALSMLDGTFKPSISEPIEINKYRDVTLGQHRYAAMQVLFSDDQSSDGSSGISAYGLGQIHYT